MPNSLDKLYYLNPQIYQTIFGQLNARKANFVNQLIVKHFNSKPVSIVDIGCGTGDILHALYKDNRTLLGLDKSEHMIRFAKKEFPGVQFSVGDMTNLELDSRYEIALCMSSTFMYNVTNEAVHSTLNGLSAALREDGVLILDLVNFIRMLKDGDFKKTIAEDYSYPEFEAKMLITNSLLMDRQAVRSKWEWTIREITGKKRQNLVVNEETTFRMFFPKELDYLLLSHGFRIEQVFSDYSMDAQGLNGHRMIVVAKKN